MSTNYGTTNNAAQNGSADPSEQERAPLLGNKANEGHALTERFHKHMTVNINKKWGDFALLGLYIITGLLDSSAVFIWGSFVSMQTGKFRGSATPLMLSPANE